MGRASGDWGLTTASRKWFMKSIGHAGLNNLLAAYEDKSAKAVCTFAYSAGPGHEPLLFQGITEGKIVPPRGPNTFGKTAPAPLSSPGSSWLTWALSPPDQGGIPFLSTRARREFVVGSAGLVAGSK